MALLRRGYPPLPSEKVADLLHRYRPRRWRVLQSTYRREHGGSGLCEWDGKVLRVPKIIDAWDAQIFLHECGHVHLGHWGRDLEHHVEEYEADIYAFHILAAERISVPPELFHGSRVVIGEAIAADMLKDPPITIDPKVQAWVDGKHILLGIGQR